MKTTLNFSTEAIPSVTRKDLLEKVLTGEISQSTFYEALETIEQSGREIRVILGEMFAQILTNHLS